MTRLRVLLSLYHPHTAACTPSSSSEAVSSYTRTTIPYKPAARAAHHTISHNRHFALSYCVPVSFCLVTPGTHPLIILGPARLLLLLLLDTKFQKGTHTAQNWGTKWMLCSIQLHPASPICHSGESTRGWFAKKMHLVSPACCAMHQAWSDAVGECIETGEELHQGLGRGGCLVVSVHPAIMSASPNLHSIAFSIWDTLLLLLDPVNL